MIGEYSYAVRFDNGKYYTDLGYRPSHVQESESIQDAKLYGMNWLIPKDLYLAQYLLGKEMTYEIVKIKVTKTYEIIND
ncbi:hypothetical protein [Sporosarcina sp. A2]|uniref:hypothetical protein n=1 Tax=Sporosarcina sp. A2 TaxID=3393449 RepID=UPI003D78C2B6